MIRYFWPSDDEQLAGQWQDSHFDEDAGWWVSVCQAGATFALAAALTTAAVTTQSAQQAFSQWQDDPAGNLSFVEALPEEYWQNPVPSVNWPQTSVFTDDDVHPTFVSVFTPDDGDWQPLTKADPGLNYVRLPFLDPEEIPVGSFSAIPNPVDDSAIWTPVPPIGDADTNVSVWMDDGSWVPALQPDEDFWPSTALPAPYSWPPPVVAFSASDEDSLIIQFPANEDFWISGVAPDPGSLIWPQQWTFETLDNSGLVAFADEVFWQNPVFPDPGNVFVFPQWPFETNDPAGSLTLTLDDSFRPDFVPPDPGRLTWPQQWTFEQNEPLGFLVPFHDEDFWTPQVPAVNWDYKQPFLSDEVIVQQSSSTIEEYYWNLITGPITFATPPALLLSFPYLPDVEENPAGTLTPPPPPPPPCFMPLPPGGPDGDINISVFSNFKGGPTLALFCRICGSPNPLVIRGDYAIWCQDCCAFVSRQDTYMGTVRAPGQFRAKF